MGAPWTRDGTVRVYVVTMAPEVAGQIVELPVADNQFVHKGDLLMVIDPTDYKIAVSLAEAAVKQAEANARNAARVATPAGADPAGGHRGGAANLCDDGGCRPSAISAGRGQPGPGAGQPPAHSKFALRSMAG